MEITKEQYKKIKKEVENYYLISIEMPGLGSACRPDLIFDKNISPSDPVGKAIVDQEYKRIIVNAINYVYDKLDNDSKKVVDYSYFRDDKTNQEVIEELKISKNRFYEIKKKAINKFMIGLRYC